MLKKSSGLLCCLMAIFLFSMEDFNDNNKKKIIVRSSVQDKWNPGTEIGIGDDTTVLDVKKALEISEVIMVDEQLFCPLVRKWWNFKLFPIQGSPLMNNNELIKNVMERCNTIFFYVHARYPY